ncbi:MAG: hypothetical protein PHH14_01690 [Candidatus Margulisbacteria bacterium]|nr:hypothetical protein [Candidatus Margulisiibacteriota bacterium]
MTSVASSLSNIYSITAKINELKNQTTSSNTAATTTSEASTVDPEQALLDLQKSFNDMLSSLLSSSDDEEDDEESDPFAYLYNSNQATTNNLTNQLSSLTSNSSSSLNISSYTGTVDDQTAAQYSALATPYTLNLDNII